MPYAHLIETCFAPAVGGAGLDEAAFAPFLAATERGLEELRRHHAAGDLPFLALPAQRDDLAEFGAVAERLRGFSRVVVLGTGGSSLGGQTLTALAAAGTGAPRLDFFDNLDADAFAVFLAGLDPAGTAFLVISKSGGTLETVAQVLVCLEAMRAHLSAVDITARFVLVSQPGDNPLRRLAARFAIPVLDHDPDLAGRFSALSLVGLLPALIAGVDAAAVRDGAATVLDASLVANTPNESAPALGAALALALRRQRNIAVSVLMPYAARLERFAMWHRQLWAESLGKDGQGFTPAPALGPVDQHSQLQLYLDGPADKFFTVISAAGAPRGPRIDGAAADDEALALLAGRTIGDVVEAERRAVVDALAANGRPVRELRLQSLDAYTMGALFMHFMLETVLTAALLGVDPYHQPAVEEGKRRARQYLMEGDGR
jgi:glucose-6-phosphate isomerase